MVISQAQKSLVAKTRSVGASKEAQALVDGDCMYLVTVIANDLGRLGEFEQFTGVEVEDFFQVDLRNRPLIDGDFWQAFEQLVAVDPNADTFFSCLGTLYKARIKYANILSCQSIPAMDQVGPRGLLQYGSMSPFALTGLLLWRKWLFDIDNRAGQETGYLFEPILAFAIGGTPVSGKKSPVRRTKDETKGRQVDCIREKRAYEFKVRVTIAASGQGRWGEELDFPVDCQNSGFIPVLIVLDPTPNAKLTELCNAFTNAGGEVYIGDDAWEHLESEAGEALAVFIEKYVRAPINDLFSEVPAILPDMSLFMSQGSITISVGEDKLVVEREPEQ